jgi:hypothetical protein
MAATDLIRTTTPSDNSLHPLAAPVIGLAFRATPPPGAGAGARLACATRTPDTGASELRRQADS